MTMVSAAFTPKAIEAMNQAYDEACAILKAENAGYPERVRAGEHIMFLARNGETDARTLCGRAIREVLGRTPPHAVP